MPSLAMVLVVVSARPDVMPWVLLYIGPDVLLPITSALAAIAGVALMFWHRLAGMVRTAWRMVKRRRD